jgi:hypothetical protein
VRNWLISILPSVDGPTIHALSEQFRQDDITTYNDIQKGVKNKVLQLNDVKIYIRSAQPTLPKMKASIVINAFQLIVVHQSLMPVMDREMGW